MLNVGALATRSVPLAIYANAYRSGGPWQYTVGPYSNGSNGTVSDFFNVGSGYGSGSYDLTVVGPNRFLRRFTGDLNNSGKVCSVTSSYAASPVSGQLAIYFAMTNTGTESVTFTITSNNYTTAGPWTYPVPAGATVSTYFDVVASTSGWYDFTVAMAGDSSWLRRYTGHLENGVASITG